jgi:AcrR family transcriptional regulator
MASKSNVADRRLERREIPDEVIEAARKKFLHFGVHRTTMADISRDVGMPRQTLYEYVASRDDLVEVVLVRRISEIADELKSLHTRSFANSLVQTAVAAIRAARSDPELMNLVSTAPKDIVQKVVVGHCQEIRHRPPPVRPHSRSRHGQGRVAHRQEPR